MLDKFELAWSAGFYDGEGHCGPHRHNGGTGARLSIGQRDPAVLERFKAAVGDVGKIYGPYPDGCGVSYHYRVGRQEDLIRVVNRIWPYLSEIKKKQILACVEV